MTIPANKRLTFVDRSGRVYTRDDFFTLMRKIYPRSPKAFVLLFPEYGMMNIKSYAKGAGIRVRRSQPWTADLDAICRELHPDYDAIAHRTGRTRKAVKLRCARMGICNPATILWTPEELSQIHIGDKPTTRTNRATLCKCSKMGLSLRSVRQVNAISARALSAKIDLLIPRGYPADKRADALQSVLEACFSGKCRTTEEALKGAAKRAISGVYKLHPDRGAPVSLDAKLFDDGGTTVGDRIASDTFHF